MEKEVLAEVRKQVLDKIYKHEFEAAAKHLASMFILPGPKNKTDFQVLMNE